MDNEKDAKHEPTAEEVLAQDLRALAQAGEQTAGQPAGPEVQAPQKPATTTPETPAADPEKPETEPEKAPEKTPEAEDDLADLPESDPQPDDWAKLRERYKKAKAQAKASREAAPERSQAVPETVPVGRPEGMAPVPQAPEKPAAERLDPGFVVSVLAKVAAGELDERYRGQAETYLQDNVSPGELREVLVRARAGGYGDKSQEVAELCREWIPVVLAGWDQKKEAEQARTAAETQRGMAWQETFKLVPGLQERTPAAMAGLQAANAELVALVPGLWQAPVAPLVVARWCRMKDDAAKAGPLSAEVTRLTAENKRLKEQAGSREAPLTPRGGGNGSRTRPATAEEELAESLAQLGVGRR